MKILIFTEGTILMHKNGYGLPREEIVEQVENQESSVTDYASYIPIGNAPKKIKNWVKDGAIILYLTSRTAPEEVEAIRDVLKRHNFYDGTLVYRKNKEGYASVAEGIMPDILIEDNCESIGGEVEMTYPHIKSELKPKIKSVIVKEFSGIDDLSDRVSDIVSSGVG